MCNGISREDHALKNKSYTAVKNFRMLDIPGMSNIAEECYSQ